MPEAELFAGCEVDHVISRKHGGLTDLANLALSCERCNRAKGTDGGSIVGSRPNFVRLFINGARIEPLTDIGEATVRHLRFHAPDRVLQRQALQQIGAYPIPDTGV